ncbi:hypothetical protein FM076_27330 [Streptomyces albus subsp. chlorinus]|uniref:hypothetical protein n=1 Tax=Streptomyces albus TaxID=1888 RepID=UPI00156E41B3|nr:hypothetical protein [Streptomyces albus]NSC24668.1 hypothetical protein [Streptomyces albus subsp. chlorinus]
MADSRPDSRRAAATLGKLREADEVCERLRTALAGAGIVLPSLRVDLASCVGAGRREPLIELGGCRLETAERLAEVLGGALGGQAR